MKKQSDMKPILFSTPMVQAILDGRKTMTRRIMKPQPVKDGIFWEWAGAGWTNDGPITPVYGHSMYNKCPFKPGDVLYVREMFAKVHIQYDESLALSDCPLEYIYRASEGNIIDAYSEMPLKWKPSIHMPKDAARIFLKVTAVKAERLLAITEDEAIAEGVEQWPDGNYKVYGKHPGKHTYARDSFLSLWESINGRDSYKSNPWVWAYTFERCDRPDSSLITHHSSLQ